MRTILLSLLISALLLVACQQNRRRDRIQIQESYYRDGSIKSEVPLKNDTIHGVVKNYYPSGKLQSRVYYSVGEKTKSLWYYETGEVYRETPYKKGKIHSIQKYYYRDKTLQAEVPYENGEPVEGTREYTTSGTLVKDKYPTIEFQQTNDFENDRILLRITMSNFSRKVKYYQIVEVNGNIVKNELPSNDGAAQLTFRFPPGSRFKNRKVTISAWTVSPRGHTYVTHADYYLNATHYR
jgi:hypothetical protein